ncbi:hypothetical protein KDD30_23165 (plasmid) [Photobacterium sp. GJ3]|uniref:hypothetical protein n=1 Tax=Photobacterium sp. GJ3 TaxID=2829502 RepID=UPI001B8D11CC|nr:hypothetical protein [Photobacterium sp. GJ3]QUJ69636.1 hypothetical protein KDD30_23165 [Photobacterium sp. GJ3]
MNQEENKMYVYETKSSKKANQTLKSLLKGYRNSNQGVAQCLAATQTVNDHFYESQSQIIDVQIDRGSNVPSSPIPDGNIERNASNQTLKHCMPYNWIRDRLISIMKNEQNRNMALLKINQIAQALGTPSLNQVGHSLYDYNNAVERLIHGIAMYGGNLFIADHSTGDGGGKYFDMPYNPNIANSLHDGVARLEAVLGMPGMHEERKRFTGGLQPGGNERSPIFV